MKLILPYILLCILTFACHPSGNGEKYPVGEWMTQDTEECLTYIDDLANPLCLDQEYDSVITLCQQVFRTFPDHPTGNPDTVLEMTRDLLLNFHNSCMMKDQPDPFIQLFDSLREAGHPYLTGPANYETLSLTALNYQLINDRKKSLAAGTAIRRPPSFGRQHAGNAGLPYHRLGIPLLQRRSRYTYPDTGTGRSRI